ncbi:alpha/beta hydrolase family protein [Tsukamurella tyrosinosolvens]|uniref:alpha/beta hydrolase family protein n=1 Tax=Tsukamurella tyrosinosolvens TaxID=57704 RepID=UPI003082F693
MTTYQMTGLTGPSSTPTVAVKPLVLPAPQRGEDLHVRISAPVAGTDLPIVLFAHGFGSNLDGYAPLVDHWASHGFVVIQATHLDSKRLDIAADDPRKPRMWHHRVQDMRHILDDLDTLEASVPGMAGRVDHTRIVAAGHSFGGQTAGILVGLRVRDPQTGLAEDLSDPGSRPASSWPPQAKVVTN